MSVAASPPSFAIVAEARMLPMRARLATPMDDEALWRFCQANRDLRVERTADGEILILPPTGSETGRRNFLIAGQLAVWAEQDGTGVGFDSSTGFLLPNGAERSPDTSWIRNERWSALAPAAREKFAPICPDFVIELRSPSDTLDDVRAKMVEYIDNGARLGWLVDPIARRVHVYRPGEATTELIEPAEVSADPELPGFVLRLRSIF